MTCCVIFGHPAMMPDNCIEARNLTKRLCHHYFKRGYFIVDNVFSLERYRELLRGKS